MQAALEKLKKPFHAQRAALRNWKTRRSPFFSRFPSPHCSVLIDSRALISPPDRFVYFRIPKAANSAVVASLLADESQMHRDSVEAIKKGGPRLSSLPKDQIDIILNEYCLFTFVRNPFARLYSCYLDKIERRKPESKKVTRWLQKPDGSNVTFDEFLDFLEHDKNIYMDAHWARQTDLIPVKLTTLHLIGSVERFDQDFNTLVDLLELENRVPKKFAPHATGAMEKLQNLTDLQVSRIVDLYRNDFLSFKYSMSFDLAELGPVI